MILRILMAYNFSLENNIKIDVREDGLIWLRIGTSGWF
jgi:hypothetical protein